MIAEDPNFVQKLLAKYIEDKGSDKDTDSPINLDKSKA